FLWSFEWRNTMMSKNFWMIFVILSCLLVAELRGSSWAQVDNRVPFKHRVGNPGPEGSLFRIRGDFAIIGNTNLTLLNYSDTSVNSLVEIVYVDVDKDELTFNSSSASLQFSQENNADPACLEILYAGLYWSGRTELGKGMSFELTKGTILGEPEKIETSTQQLSNGQSLTDSPYNLWVFNEYDGMALLYPKFVLWSDFDHPEVQF